MRPELKKLQRTIRINKDVNDSSLSLAHPIHQIIVENYA
jgi:hypothetical protein